MQREYGPYLAIGNCEKIGSNTNSPLTKAAAQSGLFAMPMANGKNHDKPGENGHPILDFKTEKLEMPSNESNKLIDH